MIMAVEMATKLKEDGNAAFKNGKFLEAAALYTKALRLVPDDAATSAVLYRFDCFAIAIHS